MAQPYRIRNAIALRGSAVRLWVLVVSIVAVFAAPACVNTTSHCRYAGRAELASFYGSRLLLHSAPHVGSSSGGRASAELQTLHLDVTRVFIPVTVLDWNDRPVAGLKRGNFRVYENGAAQDVLEFFNEDAPVGLGIVFDESGSMEDTLEQLHDAVGAFIRVSVPGDHYFLLAFSERPRMLCSSTDDVREIKARLETVRAEGTTALFDAISLALAQSKQLFQTKRALLVLSDGGENSSRFTKRQLLAAVREADCRIFCVSAGRRSRTLERIAAQSGGRAVRFRTKDELNRVLDGLSEEIHSQYVLGYSPREPRTDGKYYKIKVEFVPDPGTPQLRVYWRRGYYASSR